jgi:uncharacterized NAD-dependent epimerase/dehydratase family protein
MTTPLAASSPPGALARRRRYVALCEGRFNAIDAKTAVGVLRYGPSEVVAVVDSHQAGKRVRDAIPSLKSEAPIVASLDEALAYRPDAALVGVASPGGGIPAGWKATLLRALESGLSLVNGLHEFLGDDPVLADAARSRGLDLWDLRRPPANLRVGRGLALKAKSFVALTVGADCSVGKMTASLEIVRSLRDLGVSAEFIPTGQTGMAIAGWGCAIDAVVADFVAGAVEEMTMSRDGQAEILIVEGQGSLIHPAFSGVTLGLLHGCMPSALVACCDPTLGELKRGYGVAIPPLMDWLADYRQAMRYFRPKVFGAGAPPRRDAPRRGGARLPKSGRRRDRRRLRPLLRGGRGRARGRSGEARRAGDRGVAGGDGAGGPVKDSVAVSRRAARCAVASPPLDAVPRARFPR